MCLADKLLLDTFIDGADHVNKISEFISKSMFIKTCKYMFMYMLLQTSFISEYKKI